MASVSIIIPAYNPGSYLRQALASIEAQSLQDWELLVVDDASTEDLSWVPRDFPRARLIRQAHGGASVARNNGILHGTCEYIAFLDQDDLWKPQKLARQLRAMTALPDAAVCYSELELIDETDRPIGPAGEPAPENGEFVVELDGLSGNDGRSALHRSVAYFSARFVVPSTVMIRRRCLATAGLLDPFLPFSGDYDLLIKLGARHKVLRVPHADVLYRRHTNSFTHQYDVGRREVESLIARYVGFARAQGDGRLARDAGRLFRRPRRMYAAQAFDCARGAGRRRDYRALAYHLFRAIWFSPAFVAGSAWQWKGRRGAGGGNR